MSARFSLSAGRHGFVESHMVAQVPPGRQDLRPYDRRNPNWPLNLAIGLDSGPGPSVYWRRDADSGSHLPVIPCN
jgi:hypothetical protein